MYIFVNNVICIQMNQRKLGVMGLSHKGKSYGSVTTYRRRRCHSQ